MSRRASPSSGEFRGRDVGLERRGELRLELIDHGKPVLNYFIESFNGRMREECLNANRFVTLADARRKSKTGGAITTKHIRTARSGTWLLGILEVGAGRSPADMKT